MTVGSLVAIGTATGSRTLHRLDSVRMEPPSILCRSCSEEFDVFCATSEERDRNVPARCALCGVTIAKPAVGPPPTVPVNRLLDALLLLVTVGTFATCLILYVAPT